MDDAYNLVRETARATDSKLAEGDPLHSEPLLDLAIDRLAAAAVEEGARYFCLTSWKNIRTTQYGRTMSFTAEDLYGYFLERRARNPVAKADAEVWAPISCDGVRKDQSVEEVSLLVLDCDGNGSHDTIRSVLMELGIQHIVYETSSHSIELKKWRLVLFLATPYTVHDAQASKRWQKLYEVCRVLFGALATLNKEGFDPTTKNTSRGWYGPERKTEDQELRSVYFYEGSLLDLSIFTQGLVPTVEEREYAQASNPTNQTVLHRLFANHNMLGFEISEGKHAAMCPWNAQHTTPNDEIKSDCVIFPAQDGSALGFFKCSHASCAKRTLKDVRAYFGEEEFLQASEEVKSEEDKRLERALIRALPRYAQPEIVQIDGSYYMKDPDDPDIYCERPFTTKELPTALEQCFKYSKKVELWVPKADGEGMKELKPADVVKRYGVVAKRVKASYIAQKSFYDHDTGLFTEALCPARKLPQRYDPHIDEWLSILAGSRVDILLDWLATAPMLHAQTSAIYFSGARSAGKTLFATGLSRLWGTGGPVPLENIFGSFNDGLTRNPLVFADEDIPKGASAMLRRLLGSSNIELRRKFLPTSTIEGCPRLVIAGNNPNLLSFEQEIFGADDILAVSERIVHIEVGEDAAAFLKSLGGRDATDSWVTQDKFAKHVQWLATNRKVKLGDRFLVHGDAVSLGQHIATSGTQRNQVAECICRFLTSTEQMRNALMKKGGFRVGGGSILVNSSAIGSNWKTLMGEDTRTPTTKHIGQALAGMSEKKQQRFRMGADRPRFYKLKVDTILKVADDLGIGDPEGILTVVNAPLTEAYAEETLQ